MRRRICAALLVSLSQSACEGNPPSRADSARAASVALQETGYDIRGVGPSGALEGAVVGSRGDGAGHAVVTVAARPAPGMRDGCSVFRIALPDSVAAVRWCDGPGDVTAVPPAWRSLPR